MQLPEKTDFLVVAAMLAIFIITVTSSTFIVSYIILSNSREHEYESLRQEYVTILDRQTKNHDFEVGRLREQLNRAEFVAQKRYELQQDEIQLLKQKQ